VGETFRAGVGLVVSRSDGSVLVLERRDVQAAWQLPQGGLEEGEDSEGAAWRELREETGLTPEHVTLSAASEVWLGYELPVEYRRSKTGRGQVHQWFLFRLRKGIRLPRPPRARDAEFRARRWTDPAALVGLAVSFRRPEYAAVVRWLASLEEQAI